MEKILPNKVFYDELASDYDSMISFEKAVENKEKLFKNFVTAEMKSAADIGCGSGVDSIALSLLGLKVTSFDPSYEMIKLAEANAERMNIEIDFRNYFADNIPKEFDDQFDLVVSLGNTFANIPEESFIASLKRCYDILKLNGQLIIQCLNYEKILNENKRIVNITESADKFFIRFYDFITEHIVFNILIFSKSNPSEQKLISTKISPYSQENFRSGLEEAGFHSVKFYSDFQFTPFNNDQSKDLVVQALKL
ncbi:MAG: class I SAM-dependent methyltransferase [Ignavibacteriaceae bacterium]|nr:class I SAM-dependent methyltransferase [Ignavibacteriaceae bacterium]